jgi:hypothetical protein
MKLCLPVPHQTKKIGFDLVAVFKSSTQVVINGSTGRSTDTEQHHSTQPTTNCHTSDGIGILAPLPYLLTPFLPL